jgi:hypothetical protein
LLEFGVKRDEVTSFLRTTSDDPRVPRAFQPLIPDRLDFEAGVDEQRCR